MSKIKTMDATRDKAKRLLIMISERAKYPADAYCDNDVYDGSIEPIIDAMLDFASQNYYEREFVEWVGGNCTKDVGLNEWYYQKQLFLNLKNRNLKPQTNFMPIG